MRRIFLQILGLFILLSFGVPAVLAQDATPEAASVALVGTEWRWQELQGMDDTTITVDSPSSYTLTLREDGSLGFRADCNVGGGTYTTNESQLTLEPGPMTLAMCAEGSLGQDYVRSLGEVVSYVIEGSDLFLSLQVDGGILRFTAAPPITGVEWRWQEFQDADGTTTTVDLPANYTLMLNDDGSANVRADCNRGSGTYTLDGSQLSLSPLATTLVACLEGSLSDQYIASLGSVAAYAVGDDQLLLTLAEGGTLRFVAAPPAILDIEWQWQEFQSADGTITTVDNPANYTLTLGADSSVVLQVDCNRGSGTYTLDGSQLSFSEFATTRAACLAGSLDTQYLGYLGDVTSYVIEGGELFLSLQMDAGIMRFAPEL